MFWFQKSLSWKMGARVPEVVLRTLAAAIVVLSTIAHAQNPPQPSSTAQPIRFVENRGQIIDTRGNPCTDILFTAESHGLRLYLRKGGISYVFTRVEPDSAPPADNGINTPDLSREISHGRARITTYRLDMDLVGSRSSGVTAEDQTEEYLNFYYPHCPAGITRVHSFRRVVYHDIYPHIDLAFYTAGSRLKYDFIVHPGGSPGDIRMKYTGADALSLNGDGSLWAATPLGSIGDQAPRSYQSPASDDGDDQNGKKQSNGVSSSFNLSDGTAGFTIGGYDRSRELVIDPLIRWSTYFGGVNADVAWGAGADPSGNTLFGGLTQSVNFPTTAGALRTTSISPDAFAVKLNGNGNVIWATYFGGSVYDEAKSVAVDPAGAVILAGYTSSADLPVTSGAFQSTNVGAGGNVHQVIEGFVVKLGGNGLLRWATYLGGTSGDVIYDVKADRRGNVVVAGLTESTDFPTTQGAFQVHTTSGSTAFVTRFDSTGNLRWSTYYGGSSSDAANGVAVDPLGNVVIVGITASSDFPVTQEALQTSKGGDVDAFVVKLDSGGHRQWATFLGGSQARNSAPGLSEAATGVAIDSGGAIAVIGTTYCVDFPVTPGAFQSSMAGGGDIFVTTFEWNGALRWSTCYGGGALDAGARIACRADGTVIAVGRTTSSFFPVSITPFKQGSAAVDDGVIIEFNALGTRLWAARLGGSFSSQIHDVAAFDDTGLLVVGETSGTPDDFPVTIGTAQWISAGDADAFVTWICDGLGPSPGGLHSDTLRTFRICQGDSVMLTVRSGVPFQRWSNGATTRSIIVRDDGLYYAVLAPLSYCYTAVDSFRVVVQSLPTTTIVSNAPTTFCEGDSVVLEAYPASAICRWSTGETTRTIVVKKGGVYRLTAFNSNGCSKADSVVVTVNPRSRPVVFPRGHLSICQGDSVVLDAGATGSGYVWSTGDSTRRLVVRRAGTYTVDVANSFGCWTRSEPVQVAVRTAPDSTVKVLTATAFCEGDSAILQAAAANVQYHWSNGATTRRIAVRASGGYTLTVTDSNGCSATSQPIVVQAYRRPAPKILADGPLRFCEGDSVTLDAGPNYASYVWSTGLGSQKIVVKESGRYAVTVTNDVGCEGRSDTVTVIVDPRPAISINGPSSVCSKSSAIYSAPSTPGVRYLWSVIGGSGSIAGDPKLSTITVQWGDGGTGIVHLHVLSASGDCSADTDLEVAVGNGLVPTITADRSLKLCDGDSVTLDAGAYARYRWSTGATTRTITVRQPGSYLVTATDADGCTGTSKAVTVSINQPPRPEITSSRGTTICAGDSTVLDAGAGYAKYLWSNGYTTRTLTVRSTGTYVVTVTDDAGCTGTSRPVTVTVEATPVVKIHGPGLVCRGSTIAYGADRSGGAGYEWTVAGGTILNGAGTDAIAVQWGTGPTGTITLSEKTAGGCLAVTSLTVTIGDRLEPVIAAEGPTDLCDGGSVRLDAGAGYTSYAWSTGATTRTIDVSATGSYTVTVKDANGCSGTSQATTVTVHPVPQVAVAPAGEVTICEGDSATLTGVAQGVAQGVAWLWSTGATTQSIVVKKSGGYAVTITDDNGCTATSSPVTVTVISAPARPVIASLGDTLSSSEAERYQWNLDGRPIAGATDRRYVAREPGSYTVTVGSGGCAATSDPWMRAELPVVWLDSATAAVGEEVRLHLHVAPRLAPSNGVTGYRIVVRLPSMGLFPRGAVDVASGEPCHLSYSVDGSLVIEHHGGSAIVGDQLIILDLEGLSTAQPINPVAIRSVEPDGRGALNSIGDGLVILSGCDVGRNIGFGKRVSIVGLHPNPARYDVTVTYRAPKGISPVLAMLDVSGREVVTMSLPAGTGEEQTARLPIDRVASGLYRLELRDGDERSAYPIVIEH